MDGNVEISRVQLRGSWVGMSENNGHRTPDDLLLALRARDANAVGQLYDEYGRRAYSLAYRIVGDHGTAEDAVQEAFIALWRNAERLDPARGSVQSLLLAVVHHKAIDRLRSQRGQSRLYDSMDLGLIQDSIPESRDMASMAVEKSVMKDALSVLPVEQSRAVELAYFDGYTQVEIASIMNIPLGTVKSRLRLALERLRSVLLERDASDLPRGR